MNTHRLNVEPITRIRPNPKHRRNTHYGTPWHADPPVREAIERIREGMRLIGTRLGHRNAPTHRKES